MREIVNWKHNSYTLLRNKNKFTFVKNSKIHKSAESIILSKKNKSFN